MLIKGEIDFTFNDVAEPTILIQVSAQVTVFGTRALWSDTCASASTLIHHTYLHQTYKHYKRNVN